MLTIEEIKKLAALHAMQYVSENMTIGIGTGSTVYWFIHELAQRLRAGWVCSCVPTSTATAVLAAQLGIPMLELNEVERIDVTVDGADEIDPNLSLIKGGGSALLQEKMVAAASDKLVIIADHTKLVNRLGAFPLPVEVIPYGYKQVQRRMEKAYDIPVVLRMKEGKPLVTDHGHYILDGHFGQLHHPQQLAISLNMIPGVVDSGLFIKMARLAIIAHPDGTTREIAARE